MAGWIVLGIGPARSPSNLLGSWSSLVYSSGGLFFTHFDYENSTRPHPSLANSKPNFSSSRGKWWDLRGSHGRGTEVKRNNIGVIVVLVLQIS